MRALLSAVGTRGDVQPPAPGETWTPGNAEENARRWAAMVTAWSLRWTRTHPWAHHPCDANRSDPALLATLAAA